LRAQFAEYKEEQIEELRMIAQSAKSEQEFEERSNEARLARIKENKTKLDSLLLMDKQTGASEQAAKVYEVEQKELRALFDLELERNKEKSKYLAKQDAELQTLLEAIPQEVLITAAANKAIADVKEEGRKKEAAEQAKAQAAATARAAKYRAIRKAKEVKLQNELKAIRALELERFAIDGKSELEILELRYNDELKLAKKNSNLKTIALMRYENSKTRIENEKEQERIQNQLEANQVRLDQETALAEQRQSFIESTMAFDAQRIEDQTTKELTLLDIRYQKEIGMAEYTQEQITELQRSILKSKSQSFSEDIALSARRLKSKALIDSLRRLVSLPINMERDWQRRPIAHYYLVRALVSQLVRSWWPLVVKLQFKA
jgi:hypothetical protein